MIQAVLWDFGGVITTSPFEAFNRFERANGYPQDFIRGLNATNPDTNAWARFERSEISAAEFDRLFHAESRAAGHALRGGEVLRLLHGDLRPEMVEALRRTQARFKNACLTNNFRGDSNTNPSADTPGDSSKPAAATAARLMDTLSGLFDLVIESSKVGFRKPDPRFYRQALEGLAVEPEQAVFLDDLGINLKPARAMGIQTIKVGDPARALDELEALLGIPLRD